MAFFRTLVMFFFDLNSSGVVPVMNSRPLWGDAFLSLDGWRLAGAAPISECRSPRNNHILARLGDV